MKLSAAFLSESHPGEFIREEFLQARRMSIFQFALAMQISEKMACELISGKMQITPVLAERLATLYGVKKEYWLGMQASFDAYKKSHHLDSNFV